MGRRPLSQSIVHAESPAASAESSSTGDLAGAAQDDEIRAPSPSETARYIAEMAAELSFLARRSNLDLLAYILDMARLEATNAGRHGEALKARR
jgi:hypothetical protein